MIESDKELAVKTLREICENKDASQQAKATAARTLLELSGEIGKLQTENKTKDNKALSELTKAELDREIQKLSRPAALDTRSAKRLRTAMSKRKLASSKRKLERKNGRDASPKYDF